MINHLRYGAGRIAAKGLALVLPAVILGAAVFIVYSAVSEMVLSNGVMLHRSVWNPGGYAFGVSALVVCSLLTAIPAAVAAIVLGVPCAAAIALRPRSRLVLLALVSLSVWAGVPSIVVGLLALTGLVPLLGFSLLSGVAALVCMVLPGFILSLAALIENTDKTRFKTLLGLGFSYFDSLRYGVFPSLRGPAGALVFLTLARALGEATAVSLVIGGLIVSMPPAPLDGVETLATAVLKGFPVALGDYRAAVSAAAATLLVLIAGCVAIAAWVRHELNEGHQDQ